MARLTAASFLFLFAVAGCGREVYRGEPATEDCFPVRGRVFFDGKPCTNAVVRLHPLDRPAEGPLPVKVSAKAKGPQFISPRGDVDEKGEFQLTTFDTFDGAPEGRYAVTISWKDPEGRGGDDSDKYPELLPARFQDSRLSGLSVTIDPGDSDEIVLADFQLNP